MINTCGNINIQKFYDHPRIIRILGNITSRGVRSIPRKKKTLAVIRLLVFAFKLLPPGLLHVYYSKYVYAVTPHLELLPSNRANVVFMSHD